MSMDEDNPKFRREFVMCEKGIQQRQDRRLEYGERRHGFLDIRNAIVDVSHTDRSMERDKLGRSLASRLPIPAGSCSGVGVPHSVNFYIGAKTLSQLFLPEIHHDISSRI